MNGAEESEKIYSLACPLAKFEDVVDEQLDMDVIDELNEEINEKFKEVKERRKLFVNCRFWLNREVPKDALAIVIRYTMSYLQNKSSNKRLVLSVQLYQTILS